MSNSQNGVIVFSLGVTFNAEDIPTGLVNAFLDAFSRLKQNVIMKVNKKLKLTTLPTNVKLVDWLPQQALLGSKFTSSTSAIIISCTYF